MQATSALYKQILANLQHYSEIKINIAGVDYPQERIVSIRTSGGLFLMGRFRLAARLRGK